MTESDFPTKERRFFVTATRQIQNPQMLIHPGDHILIDPDQAPEAGKMVLVGESIETWDGQKNVRGVAVAVHTVFN